jgi:hypothetical protein
MSGKTVDKNTDTGVDTSVIDEKKGTTSEGSDSYKSRVMVLIAFLILVAKVILRILLYFSAGSLMLFLCKLAQTNILPTESKCAPYTDREPIITEVETNIFTTFSFTEPQMSMKLKIPYDINSKHSLLDKFKEYKESPSSSFLGNYFVEIIEQQLRFSYSSINSTMNILNGFLPEWLIIFLGPVIGIFIYILHNFANILYFFYLWFSNKQWFTKVNNNAETDKKPEWVDIWTINIPSWYQRSVLSFLFTMLCPVFLFIPILGYNYALISSMFYKLILNDERVTFFKIIIETLKYYKVSIVSLIILSVIYLAFVKLGPAFGVAFIVTMLMVYKGYIRIEILNDLLKPIPEKHLSPPVEYSQADKICNEPKKELEKRTWLGWILGYKSPEQKGGSKKDIDPIKALKKLPKSPL